VLAALGITASEFDWYVSDIETNYYGTNFSSDDQWINGDDLQEFLERNEVQFICAVFSAVPKGSRPIVDNTPYVDGNPDYWSGKEVEPQLRGALFEIACWDSSATLLVGLPEDALNAFRHVYPDAKPLVIRGQSVTSIQT